MAAAFISLGIVPGTLKWRSWAAAAVYEVSVYKAGFRTCQRQCSSSEAKTPQSHDTGPEAAVITMRLLFANF